MPLIVAKVCAPLLGKRPMLVAGTALKTKKDICLVLLTRPSFLVPSCGRLPLLGLAQDLVPSCR